MGFLIVIAGSLLIAVILDIAWEDTIPATFFTLLTGTFLLGVFENLDKVRYLKFGLAICIVAGYIYCIIAKDFFHILRGKLSVKMMLFFLCLIVGGNILTHFYVISWDDLNHWALVIKQTFFMNQIPTGNNSISAYSDYQPLGALASYWFLSDFSAFHEELLFPIQFFEISVCFLPFWKYLFIEKNKILKNILGLLICLVLPFVFTPHFCLQLEIDNFVAVLFLYACICIWEMCIRNATEKAWNIYALFMTAGVLAIAKSVGIYLCCVLGIALFALSLCCREKKLFVAGAGTMTVSLMLWYLWEAFCKAHGNTSYISEGFSNIGLWSYLETVKLFVKTMPWIIWIILLGGWA